MIGLLIFALIWAAVLSVIWDYRRQIKAWFIGE